jgi:WW domain-binding protein 11
VLNLSSTIYFFFTGKEARRRELKKNKKQRLLVRQTVLKGKDPTTIFSELEKIDQMEFNPIQSAPLSEKVLKEKRKKLRDTLNRIMRLYEKEEPTQWTQIKAMEVQYEKRRAELIIYCESVKHTQTVNLEEIPLPNLDSSNTSGSLLPAPPGILKKISSYG